MKHEVFVREPPSFKTPPFYDTDRIFNLSLAIDLTIGEIRCKYKHYLLIGGMSKRLGIHRYMITGVNALRSICTDGYRPNATRTTPTGVASVSPDSDSLGQNHAKRPHRYNMTPVKRCDLFEHLFYLVELMGLEPLTFEEPH